MECGDATAVADHEFAGHAVVADALETWARWEALGRFREVRSVYFGRIITVMAGAEAENEILSHCPGGDEGDRLWINRMLQDLSDQEPRRDALKVRLRRATQMLVRRHRALIEQVAAELQSRKMLSQAELDMIVPGPVRPPYQNPFLSGDIQGS